MHHRRVIVSSQGYSSSELFPSRLVQASQNRWDGLTLLVYDNQVTPDWFTIGCLDNPIVAVMTRGHLDGEIKVGPRVEHFVVPKHACTVIPAHFSGDFFWRSPYECTQLQLAAGVLARMAAEVADVDPTQAALSHRPVVEDALIAAVVLAVKGELETGGLYGRVYVESLTQLLALHLLRQYARIHKLVAEPRGQLSRPVIERAKELIHARLSEDLSLSEIATQIGVSPYHLTRLFKRSTGLSLHQYIIAERVAVARQLLQTGAVPLKEIAAQVGFADQSHFTRHFKRVVGVTPGRLADQRHAPGGVSA